MAQLITLAPKDFRSEVKPTWCPGCGDFGVLSATYKALADLHLKREEVVVVSGIGCSSRFPYFLSTYGMHTLHGRALPVATGIKLTRPDLTVLAAGGDGDLFSIGAGHTPHAAARNIDICVLNMDNQTYGLTKAQASPTSLLGHKSKSTPYGVIAQPMNPVLLALAAGASFVARGYSARPKLLTDMIKAGITHKGFAFIHTQSPCVEFHNTFEYYDQRVEEVPADHNPRDLEAAMRLALHPDKFYVGIIYQNERPTFEITAHEFEQEVRPFDGAAYLSQFA
ncbi:MAG: 2-oxoacid:ferredoxin oxidoreductase subunit beta [Chloroflexi bacterium]|nr:2-oxoacid:ferredoxin oxidoreductase subunit beta [Chloroflexota bacterium]